MKFEESTAVQRAEQPTLLQQVDQRLAALAAVPDQLEQQARVLQAMSQELAALRATQTAYHETLIKLDRQMRWTRWWRGIRSAIFWLFWLGVAGILAYYWEDLSNIWDDWARFIL
jgi:hypothetical protein